ncbi:similar to Saccharomyces cerevisiae YER169W RPH1 JmjC domain-containing histone demethylase [Maudiozyma saulgeensis]|uniref:Similar to Saccharomyces cerevisiae YER169W RPH1 JmjC domain-containing histone demethylase n=1 Tax=Maudiozyma saulgeensis TaxID=1789683 RepID=A0A1X7R7M4_9SACH|nr:similar to Saccharomyces cerevisiae YER169W RPH1 JmjC domain-containing histone demethylase [Kazachstania saulgeensis]
MNGFVTPDHFSDGGIPIFKPTFEQFKDFYQFIKSINSYGMQSGIVKIIPPQEWLNLQNLPIKKIDLEKIKIFNPTQQQISGEKGIYVVQNIEKNKKFNLLQWKNLSLNYPLPSSSSNIVIDNDKKLLNFNDLSSLINSNTALLQYNDKERLIFLENYYWKTLNFTSPLYGSDSPGSFFSKDLKIWNVSDLPNFLDYLDEKIPGVNESYLYAGLWKSSFTWHLEDKDLYSINYIHFGAPKQWYSIPQSHEKQFLSFVKEQFPQEFKSCPEFLRHKQIIISPKTLRDNGIPVNKITHYQNEFIITFPYGYHSGFNYGFNLAESVNFATDDWLDIGERAQSCNCINDSVRIDVKKLRENWENNKNRKFNELLNHSSQELQNMATSLSSTSSTTNKIKLQNDLTSSSNNNNNNNNNNIKSNINGLIKESSMAPLFPNMSLRSTSPSLNQSMNQINPSLSRVSSPFLSRMMDLSNIIEPTLDDQTLKRRLVSPQPLTMGNTQMNSNQQQRQLQQQQQQQQQLQQHQQQQIGNQKNQQPSGSVPLAPLAVRSFTTPSSALFDYNDDNLLALSLTSMANSGNSSPRLRKPMLNSPIDHFNNNINNNNNGNSNGLMTSSNNYTNSLRPLFSPSANNSTHQLAYETVPLSNNNRLLNNSTFTPNNMNTSSPLLQSYPSNFNISSPTSVPFIKRPKSSNIVTLNISRESSRSPIALTSIENTNSNQILPNGNNVNGSNNINNQNNIKYSSLNQIENPSGRIPMDNGMPLTKKQKLGKRVLSSPSSGLATAIPISNALLANDPSTITTTVQNNNHNNLNNNNIDNMIGIGNNDEFGNNSNEDKKIPLQGTTVMHNQPSKFTSEEVVVSKFGKVYVCQECKRQFSSGHHLTRHKKSVHSGEKPYSCPKCGKRFKRRDHVLQHLNKKIPCVPTAPEP